MQSCKRTMHNKFSTPLQGSGREVAGKTAQSELKVAENALRENPKSYSAWHHRMWIMRKGLSSLTEEIQQVNK